MHHNAPASQATVDASKAKYTPNGPRKRKPRKKAPNGRADTATVDDTRSPPDKTEKKAVSASTANEKETRPAWKSNESARAQKEGWRKSTAAPSIPKVNPGSRPQAMTNQSTYNNTQREQKVWRGNGWKNRRETQQKNGDDGTSVLNSKNPQRLPKREPEMSSHLGRQTRGGTEQTVNGPESADNPNGLKILLSGGLELMEMETETGHPWRKYHQREFEVIGSISIPLALAAPANYSKDSLLISPEYDENRRNPEARQAVTMNDVVAFRAETAKKWKAKSKKEGKDGVGALTAGISTLSTSKGTRRVIYRYTAAVWKSMGILEAIHFELFLPNRPDLRFLAVPYSSLPSGTIEGEYFLIHDVHLIFEERSTIQLGGIDYPLVWRATNFAKMTYLNQEIRQGMEQGLAYIVQHSKTADVDLCVGPLVDCEFAVPAALYTDAADRVADSLVKVTMRYTSGAHLYPVEAPRRPEYDAMMGRHKGKGTAPEPKNPSWYVKEVAGVKTTSQREGRFPCGVEALSRKEKEKIEDRLADFKEYGPSSLGLMHSLFVMGSLFRLSAGKSKEKETEDDCVELQVDESVILRTLRDHDLLTGGYEALMDLIYKWNQKKPEKKYVDKERHTVDRRDGTTLTLNHQQSRALRHYTGGERAFCILSPPGSGKTTVAAAMAAAVACDKAYKGVQLLVAVQNVAVDNIGTALKGFRHGKGVYNVKATKRLDPFNPAPYDFFDGMDQKNRGWWQNQKKGLADLKRNDGRLKEAEKEFEESLSKAKTDYERGATPTIVLATVEMVLCKMFGRKCNFYGKVLSRVDRVIIDEASLLTEAALYSLIRRFPKAEFVFIGDNKQLPPFMYDPKVLGHELAGRSALSVVMKNGNIPVIQLDEVYRAPPSLVEPYNRLSYDGRLISRKPEEDSGVLSVLRLIPPSNPQLLFVEVNGKQERNQQSKSLYNEMEKTVLLGLLKKLPARAKEEMMIICLYKEQKKRLQATLGKGYTILTVDSSQGKEKAIVILLTTRTEQVEDMGFFCCQKRCTVAISRQQRALIILGQPKILTTNHPWSTVVNGDDFTRMKGESLVKKHWKGSRSKEG